MNARRRRIKMEEMQWKTNWKRKGMKGKMKDAIKLSKLEQEGRNKDGI